MTHTLKELYDRFTEEAILLSLVWLMLFSTILPHSGVDPHSEFGITKVGVLIACLLLWTVFIADYILLVLASKDAPDRTRRLIMGGFIAIVPPLRMMLPTFSRPTERWIPFNGWLPRNKKRLKLMQRVFSVPMICIVLMVLPIMLIERFRQVWVEDSPTVAVLLDLGAQFVWLAFAYEFIVMVSLTPQRKKYIMKHLLDVAVILLPLILLINSLFKLLPLVRLLMIINILQMQRIKRLGLKLGHFLMVFLFSKQFNDKWERRKVARLEAKIEVLEEELEDLREERREVQEVLNRFDPDLDASLPATPEWGFDKKPNIAP